MQFSVQYCTVWRKCSCFSLLILVNNLLTCSQESQRSSTWVCPHLCLSSSTLSVLCVGEALLRLHVAQPSLLPVCLFWSWRNWGQTSWSQFTSVVHLQFSNLRFTNPSFLLLLDHLFYEQSSSLGSQQSLYCCITHLFIFPDIWRCSSYCYPLILFEWAGSILISSVIPLSCRFSMFYVFLLKRSLFFF